MIRTRTLVLSAALPLLALTACDTSSPSSAQADQSTSDSQMKVYQRNQPVPKANFSEMRQTLIEVESAEINGTVTTAFFFQHAAANPTDSCPSIGYPIPATTELTNPSQIDYTGGNGGGNVAVPQQDPTGVFAGPTSGTFVVCVQPDGTKRVDYWEGDVRTVGGPAHWDPSRGIVLDGKATVVQGAHK